MRTHVYTVASEMLDEGVVKCFLIALLSRYEAEADIFGLDLAE